MFIPRYNPAQYGTHGIFDTQRWNARSRRASLGAWTWNQAQGLAFPLRRLTAVLTLPEGCAPCGHAAEAFLGVPLSHVRKSSSDHGSADEGHLSFCWTRVQCSRRANSDSLCWGGSILGWFPVGCRSSSPHAPQTVTRLTSITLGAAEVWFNLHGCWLCLSTPLLRRWWCVGPRSSL